MAKKKLSPAQKNNLRKGQRTRDLRGALTKLRILNKVVPEIPGTANRDFIEAELSFIEATLTTRINKAHEAGK